MKQGWEIKKLGDVCGFQNGFAFKSKTFKETGFPVLRISNIQKDKIDLNKIVFIDQSDYSEDLSKYKVEKNDLLIAMSGATTGKIGFNQTDDTFYLNQRVGKFEPTKKLSKQYLYYFLSTKVEESLKISAGVAQPNLSTQQIKSFELPLPPLDEQKRIVAKLDECFEAIDKARANVEKNLNNAKELFQSKLNDIFSQKGDGWVENRFGDICHFVRGPFGGSLKKSFFVEDGIAVYEQRNAIYDQFEQIRYFITDDKFQEMKRFRVKSGDLIMSCSGTIGKVAIVPTNVKNGIINQALLKLSPSDLIVAEYLKYWMESENFHKQISLHSKGAAIKNVASVKVLKEIQVPTPTIDEQKKAIFQLNHLLNQTQSLESNYQQELNALDELKKSILEKAFNGEL